MNTKEKIGKVAACLRRRQAKNTQINMTQAQVSKEVGITQGTLSKIENGILELGASELLKLVRFLRISPNDFFDLVELYQGFTQKEFDQIVEIFFEISPTKFKQLIQVHLNKPDEFPEIIDSYIASTLSKQKQDAKRKPQRLSQLSS